MNRSTYRIIILITAVITGLVHLVLLNIFTMQFTGSVDLLFTLNGLGFLGLTAALFLDIPFLKGYEKWIIYAFMAFTLATIIAWVAVGERSTLGYLTKLDEVILLATLGFYLREEA
jgi:ABC-type microcin C transport system permease subunit YejB